MSKSSIPFSDALSIVMNCVAVKVQDWDDALLYPAIIDDGFEIVDNDNIASVSGGEVVKENFEGGFKLTFNDDAGDTITLVPLGYIKA